MKYNISKDIQFVCTILGISQSQLAESLGVARSTIARIVKGETYPSDLLLESFYSFCYKNNIRQVNLNQLKIEFGIDTCDKILFHGAKTELVGNIDLSHSRSDIDIGVGFYLGESYDQASSYIFPYKRSSIYMFDVRELEKLKVKEFGVSLEWMLMVSYFRGQLDKYKKSKVLNEIIDSIKDCDVVIAPIADNNMYEIMNRFARGDITDAQAIASLSASSLGKQHVLKTEKACKSIKMIDRLYLCNDEREAIKEKNKENALVALDKYKIAVEKYRRLGKYVEEILK